MDGEVLRAFVHSFITREYYWSLFQGAGMTLAITAIAAGLGLLIGLVMTILQTINLPRRYRWLERVLRMGARIYVELIRGTPVMVQLIFIWIVVFGTVAIPKILAGGIAFGINSGAYTAELLRGALQSLDTGQVEAGRSLGLSQWQTLRYVIWPQAWRNVLPGLVNEFVSLLKETAVIGAVGGMDLTRAGQIMISTTGNAAIPLCLVASIYLCLTLSFSLLARRLEAKVHL